MSKKIQVTIYPTIKQQLALEKIAKKMRVPSSVLIREGIDMILASEPVQTILGTCQLELDLEPKKDSGK